MGSSASPIVLVLVLGRSQWHERNSRRLLFPLSSILMSILAIGPNP
jgi:hypothetical protein